MGRAQGPPLRIQRWGLGGLLFAPVKGIADFFWEASPPDDVPETVCEAIARILAQRAVMVEVVALDVAEIGIAEIVKVAGMMDPLFERVTFDDARNQGRQRVNRRKKTERRHREKQRQQVFQLAIDMVAVERMLVVVPVERIEPLVREPADESRARAEMPVQDPAVENVFLEC